MTELALLPDATVHRRSIYFGRADALVLADIHIGRDAASAVEFPLGEREDLTDRLSHLLDRFSPSTVVIAGDLLHSFDRIPETVFDTIDRLLDRIESAGAALVVVRGNHDTMLSDAVADGLELELREAYPLSDEQTVVCHGHELPDDPARRYVIGHEHPAITIEGHKHPCHLVGHLTYDGSDVIVLPAFNRLARGTAINGLTGRDAHSPMLSSGVGDYRPVVYDTAADEPLDFPPLAQLRSYL